MWKFISNFSQLCLSCVVHSYFPQFLNASANCLKLLFDFKWTCFYSNFFTVFRIPLKVVKNDLLSKVDNFWELYYFLQVNMIERVNGIFTQVDWGIDVNGYRLSNLGFLIKEIKIFERPTSISPVHFNSISSGRGDGSFSSLDVLKVLWNCFVRTA